MDDVSTIGAVASIATQETDAVLREREYNKGRAAKLLGLGRIMCPWVGGLTQKWWLEGYESISVANVEK
jgi:ribosome modulation factor